MFEAKIIFTRKNAFTHTYYETTYAVVKADNFKAMKAEVDKRFVEAINYTNYYGGKVKRIEYNYPSGKRFVEWF